MQQNQPTDPGQIAAIGEPSGSHGVPESLTGLFRRHGVDAGSDSRLRVALRTVPVTAGSLLLACLGLCQGVVMALAGDGKPLPLGVAVLAGLLMLAASLRLGGTARFAQREDLVREIVLSLVLSACVMTIVCISPVERVLGVNLPFLLSAAFLAIGSAVVAAGLVDRRGAVAGWSRIAAPVVALCATFVALF